MSAQQESTSKDDEDEENEANEAEDKVSYEERYYPNRLRSMVPRLSIVEAMGTENIPANLPIQPMKPLKNIAYHVNQLPEKNTDAQKLRELLAKTFPKLCEAPHQAMVDDHGEQLPPLKYEETSAAERKARMLSLDINVRGTKRHTLVKSFVVLESRSTSWKRMGAFQKTTHARMHGSSAGWRDLPALDPLPSPWDIEIFHEDAETQNIKGTARRIFELPSSRRSGLCPKCDGDGVDACTVCKGEEPDECFWCTGTGRELGRQQRCSPCSGSGKLQCKACSGKLSTTCKSCQGEGTGHFAVIVQIKVRRVDFAPIPLPTILREAQVTENDTEGVKRAIIRRTWEAINKLTEASGIKHKHAFRPLSAACSCDTSYSQLLEVDVPRNGTFRKFFKASNVPGSQLKQSRSLQALKQEGKLGKCTFAKRYYVVPSDSSLQPVEMSEDDFELSILAKKQASAQLISQGVRPAATIMTPTAGAREGSGTLTSVNGWHTQYQQHLQQQVSAPHIAFAHAPPMTPSIATMMPQISPDEAAMAAHPHEKMSRSSSQSSRGFKKLTGSLSSIISGRLTPSNSPLPLPSASPPGTPLAQPGSSTSSFFGSNVSVPPDATGASSDVLAPSEARASQDDALPRRARSLRSQRSTGTTTAGKYHHARSPPSGRASIETSRSEQITGKLSSARYIGERLSGTTAPLFARHSGDLDKFPRATPSIPYDACNSSSRHSSSSLSARSSASIDALSARSMPTALNTIRASCTPLRPSRSVMRPLHSDHDRIVEQEYEHEILRDQQPQHYFYGNAL